MSSEATEDTERFKKVGGSELRKLGKEMLGNEGWREDGRQREKERLLCGQPVCEEVGRAPVASQWASVNHMATSLSPSLPLSLFSSLFLSLRWWAGQCSSGPSLLLTAGIIISITHTLQTHCNSYHATLTTQPLITHTHSLICTYTQTHRHTQTGFEAPSLVNLPHGQTKKVTLCINLARMWE